MLKKIKYAVFMLLMLLVVGLGEKKKNLQKKKLDTVDIVLTGIQMQFHCFLYNAIEKGYFEEEGIKVNIHFPSNASDPYGTSQQQKS